ncbi:Asp-tRNA(Asn)/Glu-tRNA(Gln) amidotransferase subunit GatA [Patescibacteria group bacterium]|nr:Asp-tRNA(Asn)/Glu-tRNA(Gln) amidotransferase subunit GatA [Patescibacteria group bacterium]
MDISNLTIESAHEALKNKEISCVDMTKAFLDNAKKSNDELNIFITISEEEALQQALEVDKKIAAGEEIGILEGIPVGIKDLINTKGVRTTCASKMLDDFVPPYDATVVKKLRDLGMVMIGKTNLDEFACGVSTEHSYYGVTKNPHNPEYVSGGSSGGSAAALVVNSCLYTLGTDTGGSVRAPASFCGIVGMKGTYGRVSRSGVTAMASSLDTVAPLAKNVRDTAIVFQAIAGLDNLDSTTLHADVPNYLEKIENGVSGMKIGIPKEYFSDDTDPEVKQSVMDAVKELEKQGAEIVNISLPSTKYAVAFYYIVMPAELSANLARFDGIRFGHRPKNEGDGLVDYYFNARGEGFGDEIKRRIMVGTYVLSAGYKDAYYKKAQKVRTLIIRDFEEAFQKVDAIVGPTVPYTAFKIGDKISDPLMMYLADVLTIPVSAAGCPAISVPCGKNSKGLPIGMQIAVPQLEESRLFQIARAYEKSVS